MLLRAFVLLVLCRFVIDGDKPEDRKLSTSGHDPKLDFKLHETIKYTDNKGKSLCLPIPVSFNNYNEVSSFHYDIVAATSDHDKDALRAMGLVIVKPEQVNNDSDDEDEPEGDEEEEEEDNDEQIPHQQKVYQVLLGPRAGSTTFTRDVSAQQIDNFHLSQNPNLAMIQSAINDPKQRDVSVEHLPHVIFGFKHNARRRACIVGPSAENPSLKQTIDQQQQQNDLQKQLQEETGSLRLSFVGRRSMAGQSPSVAPGARAVPVELSATEMKMKVHFNNLRMAKEQEATAKARQQQIITEMERTLVSSRSLSELSWGVPS
jgi:hypothetical protein